MTKGDSQHMSKDTTPRGKTKNRIVHLPSKEFIFCCIEMVI